MPRHISAPGGIIILLTFILHYRLVDLSHPSRAGAVDVSEKVADYVDPK
jgi:hypothetical protein